MPHEMCFLAHRGVWFERVKVEKYPIRLNSLLNYHISNHIWLHVRSKMISKSDMLIITAQNNPEQFHDQIVLIQPLFLNLIRKHFFPALSTPPGRFQELKNKFANILWQSKHLKCQLGQKKITFSKRSVWAPPWLAKNEHFLKKFSWGTRTISQFSKAIQDSKSF